MAKPGKAEKWAARGERLSAALRENLKRRKEQARERDLQNDLQSDLQRDLARQPVPGGETPATEAEVRAQTPEFRRNRGGE
jgi:hypothetical protein